jgi:hypothetical protein
VLAECVIPDVTFDGTKVPLGYKVNASHQMSRANGRSWIQISDGRRATPVSDVFFNPSKQMDPVYANPSPNIFLNNANKP